MSKETATTNTIINSQALKSIMRLEGKTAGDIAAALNITRKHAEKKNHRPRRVVCVPGRPNCRHVTHDR